MGMSTNVYQRVKYVRVKSQSVCHFWKQGKCNRNPCRFAHGDPSPQRSVVVRSNVYHASHPKNSSSNSTHADQRKNVATSSAKDEVPKKKKVVQKPLTKVVEEVVGIQEKKACEDWMSSGKCSRGDGCPFLHSWFDGDAFSMLARLEGHNNNVSGIDISSHCEKLFSGSSDGIVHAWDCHTGKIVGRLDVGGKIGCLIAEGDWVFVGLPNLVKALNTKSGAQYNLTGAIGEVYALETGLGVLYAASQNGVIVAWRVVDSDKVNPFQRPVYLKGHKSAVICLRYGAGKLYSGSMDGIIKKWDNKSLECLETFKGHDDAVMSLLCFDTYLLSCSLDQKIKVWATSEKGNLEMVYTHEDEDCGALALCGVDNPNGNDILACSWNNDTVSVYELPSFIKRGKIYAKGEVRSMRRIGDMLLTGDSTGMMTVWKLAQSSEEAMAV